MKKNILLILGLIILLGVNAIVSNPFNDRDLLSLEKIAFADGEGDGEFDCYSWMTYSEPNRVLECNTPCCFRNHYRPNDGLITGGKCTGPFVDCTY